MKRALYILGAVFLLAGAVEGWLAYRGFHSKTFFTGSHETTFSWSEAPDLELNADSLKKLSEELHGITEREQPGKQIDCRVVSLGKREVETLYTGSEEISPSLLTMLDSYVKKRLPELAQEQANGNGG